MIKIIRPLALGFICLLLVAANVNVSVKTAYACAPKVTPTPKPTCTPKPTHTPSPTPTPETTPSPTITPEPTVIPETPPSNPPGFSPPGPGGTPVCDSARPAAPVVTSVVRNGSSATVSWNKVDLADHYVIAYGLQPGNYIYGVPNTGNVSSFTINALDPSTQYYFAVRAVNNCMPSESGEFGGMVLGMATGKGGVLGLAATGDNTLVYGLAGFSALMFIASLLSNRKYRAQ